LLISSSEDTGMTLRTTAFRTVLIILAAAAILQVHSALTSEPAITTAATTIHAGG
jgi:hypothetical protein